MALWPYGPNCALRAAKDERSNARGAWPRSRYGPVPSATLRAAPVFRSQAETAAWSFRCQHFGDSLVRSLGKFRKIYDYSSVQVLRKEVCCTVSSGCGSPVCYFWLAALVTLSDGCCPPIMTREHKGGPG